MAYAVKVRAAVAYAISVATAAAITMFVSFAWADGVWKFVKSNEHIQYREGSRLIFALGCSKLVGFDVFYPDQSRKEGQTAIELSNGNKTVQYQGELYVPASDSDSDFEQGAVMLFVQLDDEDDLLDLLSAGLPITVTTDAGKIALPAPTIKDLKDRWNNAC